VDAALGHAVRAAELIGLGAVADHDETDGNAEGLEISIELAQLRERFSKERSTDVPQPDHEGGPRQVERAGGCGKRCADGGGCRLVHGRGVSHGAPQIMCVMSEPLSQDVFDGMIAHMNDDHADAVLGYAQAFGGHADARSARMTGMDARGFDMAVDTPLGSRSARIDFDHELADAEDAKQSLIQLAMAARVRQG
jgi:hypothetical protein